MNRENIKNRILSSKGGATVLVAFTVFTFIVVLTTVYISISTNRESQLKSDLQIQEIYKEDYDKVDTIYSDLTSNYKEKLEYLESTDAHQYIDTGVVFNSNMRMEIKLEVPATETTSQCAFGLRKLVNGNVRKGFYECGKQIIVADDAGYETKSTGSGVITYIFKGNNLKYNDTTQTYTKTCTNTDENMYLFALNNSGSVATHGEGVRIYYCRIWDENNQLILDLIPCLDNSNVPCMFDKVTKSCKYNKGGGMFLHN